MSHRSRTARTLVAVSMAAILAGCGGDNPTKPKPQPPPQLLRTTPENVLRTLEYVYSHRDSSEIKSLYDSTYTGQSQDLTGPPVLLAFTYSDEVEHVAALARAHSITNVVLAFGPLVRVGSNDPSHPEWAMIQIPGNNMQLEIQDGADAYQVAPNGLTESFSFRPIAPDSTSPTDTTWKIVRWSEVYTGGP